MYLTLLTRKTIDAQIVELKLTPVHSGGSCPPFVVKPFVREEINVRTKVVDVESLEVLYPNLEPVPLRWYCYGDIKMILGQDVFHCIRPMEYFKTDRTSAPIAVRLPLGWVLSGSLPSTSRQISTCFKAVTQKGHRFKVSRPNPLLV